MKILVIDNYDSFVYNLVYILKSFTNVNVTIAKNDKIYVDAIKNYDKILLSPGPGIPKDAGIMPELIKKYASTKSILGVCLGHQAIGEAFGATLYNLPEPFHGIASAIYKTQNDYLFNNINNDFIVGHYHSWIVKNNNSSSIEILAKDANDNIMALKHIDYDVRGVQFHPESILTPNGYQIIKNWVNN